MLSERIQRRVGAALDEAEAALDSRDWSTVLERAEFALTLDPGNAAATALRESAQRGLQLGSANAGHRVQAAPSLPDLPPAFVSGRYQVREFLGEGGKKRVYLAHDEQLDRDVAFALIKTEGLDLIGRERVTREAQAMGRLGTHPQVVTIFEIGGEDGAPYVVTELMGGRRGRGCGGAAVARAHARYWP